MPDSSGPVAGRYRSLLSSCLLLLLLTSLGVVGGSCSKSSTGADGIHPGGIPASGAEYVVLAWNDLGMHCLNPTYDRAVILPPYNTVWAQVIERGNPPVIVTAGLTAEYRIVDNTRSYGKTDALGGDFGQFWDNADSLFGVSLAHDTGLNLEDPQIHNGLSGAMVVKSGRFQVNGIPVVPVNDAGVWSPYQVAEITIKKDGVEVARTRTTVPTSDEIHCGKCHQGPDPFADVLAAHNRLHGTTLARKVLCAGCHGSPALGLNQPGPGGYLSAAIHGAHAARGALCYDCHPGTDTQCNRSLAHTRADGNCTTCHGDLAAVSGSIRNDGRIPWAAEPKCVACHTGVQEVDTGTTLYRNAQGHGNLYCPACHGSPHAMHPSRQASDDYQPVQDQGKNITIGSCGVCHDSSRGGGIEDFAEEHGPGGRTTACGVCHTAVSADAAHWPHAYTWKAR